MHVFERLVEGDDVVLAHTFFYDTISASRGSPLTILSQFGFRRVATKAIEAIASSLRRLLGRRLGKTWVRAKSPYEFAVINNLPHSMISDINHSESIKLLQSLNVDVLLVCVCKNILRKEVLAIPNMKFVNVHPSLLPRYRGPTPTFWMLYYGEHETGVTYHLMTSNIDEGKILAQRSMPLDRSRSEFQIEMEVFQVAGSIVLDVLRNLDSDAGETASSSASFESSYYTFPTPLQRRELKQRLA